MKSSRTLLIGAAAISALCAPESSAQQVAQAVGASGLEEIVVTARRREENIQSVPVAITALSTEDIRERNITNMYDVARATPAFNPTGTATGPSLGATNPVAGDATRKLNLRGLPGVAQYFAEVPGQVIGLGNFMDLQNVQVLTGPQGTLFGLNATGGAFLLEPKHPTNNIEGYIDGTFARFDHRILEGALNVPVIDDKVLVRVAARREKRDGWVTVVDSGKKISNIDTWAWRGGITIKPTEDVENYFVYHGSFTSQHQPGYMLLSVNPTFYTIANALRNAGRLPASGPGSHTQQEIEAYIAQAIALGPRKQLSLTGNDTAMEHNHMIVDQLTWRISDNLLVKNIFGYRRTTGTFRYDADGTPAKLYTPGAPEGEALVANQSQGWGRTWSDELQLQGSGMLNGKFDWTVGGFLTYSRPNNRGRLSAGNCSYQGVTSNLTTTTSLYTYGTPPFLSCSGPSRSDTQARTQALFGQGTYDLGGIAPALDGLKLTAGLRYNWDMRSTWTQSFRVPPLTGCQNALSDANCIQNLHGDWKALSYTFAIDYQITPDVMLYATTRKGYSSGGFNSATANPALQLVPPEYNVDYEVGAKADWAVAGMRGRSNIAFFTEGYTNIQRAKLAFNASGGAFQATYAADARIRGFDVNVSLRPVDELELIANGTYIDSYYTSFITPDIPPQDFSSHPLQGTPKWRYNLGFRYTLPLDETMGRMTFTWNTAYTGRNYVEDAFGTPQSFAPAFRVTDLRLDWKDLAGFPIDAAAFVRNLFDKQALIGTFFAYNTLMFNSGLFTEPRTYGIQIRYRFGD